MDTKDKTIMEFLRKDSRIKLKELSRFLRMPPSTIHDRIGKLEANGYIKKWTVVPDYLKTGRPITSFILVRYTKEDGITQEELAKNIAEIPGIFEVHSITGEWDLILKVRSKDINDLKEITVDKLAQMKGIGKRMTMSSLLCTKEDY